MRLGRGGRVAVGVAALGAAGVLLRSLRPDSRPAPHPVFRGAPLLIAHRGGAELAPENTIEACRQAESDWAADMIEIDARASSDGHCVIIHDPTVDRTTDGTGEVAGLTLEELRSLDAGYRFSPDGGRTHPFRGRGVRIPTIEEVLEALPRMRFIVEVKTGAAQQPLLDAVRRAGAEDLVVAAGSHDRDRTLFRQYPGPVSASARQCARLYFLHRLRLARLWRVPADAIHIPEVWADRRVLTPRLIRDIHAQGLPVHVWTVNDPSDMRRLLDWGVDGIMTDRPDLLADLLTERYGRPPAPARARGSASAEGLE